MRKEKEWCPRYGHCYDESGIIIDESKCKSGDLQIYITCERYDFRTVTTVEDRERLRASLIVLGIELKTLE